MDVVGETTYYFGILVELHADVDLTGKAGKSSTAAPGLGVDTGQLTPQCHAGVLGRAVLDGVTIGHVLDGIVPVSPKR